MLSRTTRLVARSMRGVVSTGSSARRIARRAASSPMRRSGWCTVGGNVATNAGGLCCVKYGVTADHVLGLQVVLPGGEVIRTGRRTAKGVAARDCSTGEQKALLVSLILANARAIEADGTAPLLLLDEVAAHLDPGRRASLYDEVCGLGLQAFMTGTEPGLFAELGARAQHWEAAEEGGVSHLIERSPP